MANARLAIVEPNNYLEKGVKIEEAALPLRLSAAEIRDQVNTQAGLQVPSLLAEQVPVLIEDQVPPAVEPLVEAQVPPLVQAQVPPLVEAQVPPLVEAQVPPLVQAQVPPAVATAVPPVVTPLVQAQVPPLVQAQVPPLVASAIAADSTPANAAAAAVNTKLTEAGVAKGAYPTADQEVSFVIVDAEGRRSWIEVGVDGKPTSRVADILGAAVSGTIDAKIAQKAIPAPAFSEVVTFSITDQNDQRSWLEIGLDGKPTQNAVQIMAAALATSMNLQIESNGRLPQTSPDHLGLPFSVIDSQDRRSWLEVGPDGGPTDNAVKLFKAKFSGAYESAPAYSTTSVITSELDTNGRYQLYSNSFATGNRTALTSTGDNIYPELTADGTKVTFLFRANVTDRWRPRYIALTGGLTNAVIPTYAAAWGDSLTFSSGGLWETVVEATIGMPVVPLGVSGERAEGIAVRQGGITRNLTVANGTIPASGGVTVTPDGTFILPNQYMSTGVADGTLAGVKGTISVNNNVFTFTRTTPGTAVNVPTPQPWISDDSIEHRDALHIFWPGRNSFPNDISGDPAQSAAGKSVIAMVANMKALSKRFIVMPVINGSNEGNGQSNQAGYNAVVSYEAWLKATFPDNFVDLRRELIDNGLAKAGITSPTAQDLSDVAADTIPQSLRSDYIHLTTAAYQKVLAPLVAQFIINKGWNK